MQRGHCRVAAYLNIALQGTLGVTEEADVELIHAGELPADEMTQ